VLEHAVLEARQRYETALPGDMQIFSPNAWSVKNMDYITFVEMCFRNGILRDTCVCGRWWQRKTLVMTWVRAFQRQC